VISESGGSRIVLSALLLILAVGFAWMGVWGLRGRDTHMPGAGALDLNPAVDPDTPPLRGKAARWTGLGFLLIALAMLGAMLVLWR
jgi:hypothetical protein